MARRGRLYAVVCISQSATEIVNDFLTTANKDISPSLIVITSLSKSYADPSVPALDSFETPFPNKSPSQCCNLIRQLTTNTESDLNYEYLVILDDRSDEDKTALVVFSSGGAGEEELKVGCFRAEWKIVNIVMGAMMAKGLGREYKEVADGKSDGVLRF